MMPFSVLRMWLLGLWGWALLGGGLYLLYEWSDGVTPPQAVEIEVSGSPVAPDTLTETRTLIVQDDRQGGTSYLIGGIFLMLLSTGGVPIILRLLGVLGGNDSPPKSATRSERIARPDGSALRVDHVGPETAPTLLLTHGWSLDRSDWDGVRDALGDRYHLVCWDLAGLGESTAPDNADHSLEKMAADLEAVLTHATSGPVILIGHSIGGMIQQTFCRLFPSHLNERVQALVFVHTTYTNPTRTAMGSAVLTALQKPVLEPLTHLTIWLSPLVWLSNWQSYGNGSLHLSARLMCFAGRQTWRQVDHVSRLQARAWPAVVSRGNLAMTRFDEQATMPEVHVPSLVIAGAQDRLTRPDASHRLARLLPDAQVVTLEPAGHFGHWEHESEFHRALSAFMDSLALDASPLRTSVSVI